MSEHRPPHRPRNRILRVMVINWILGTALGAMAAALVLWLDIAHLRALIWHGNAVAWEALVLLFGGFAVTFGASVCGAALMTVPLAGETPSGGRGREVAAVRIAASAARWSPRR